MKQLLKLSLMLITLILLSIVISKKPMNKQYQRKEKLGIAPYSLALLLKKLGAQGSVSSIASDIEYNCGNKRLLRYWIRIVASKKLIFSRSTQHPFILRRFWYIYHKHRILIVRQFLKSFLKCGRVPGSQRAFKRIIISYAATRQEKKLKVLKIIQRLKKAFFTKKKVNKKRDNNTIYPTYLLKKIIKLRSYMIKCLKSRVVCMRFEKNCKKSKSNCKRALIQKRKINPRVHKIFVNYFANLWHDYISNPSISRIRIYIVRKYRRKYYR